MYTSCLLSAYCLIYVILILYLKYFTKNTEEKYFVFLVTIMLFNYIQKIINNVSLIDLFGISIY